MQLKFFGRGAGFTTIEEGHTSAYFENDKTLVLIDCPMTTFFKLKVMNLSKFDNVDILITHTHADHISGLGLFIQFCTFVCKLPVTVIAPSKEVFDDLRTVLRIEGNEDAWYKLVLFEDVDRNWKISCVLTTHSPQLANKCFGYVLNVNNVKVIYTGDTGNFEDFKPFIEEKSEVYVDTSVYYGQIHLKLTDMLEEYKNLTKQNIKVYLTHLDYVETAKDIIKDIKNIFVVELNC
jgi:ribonuclease BN (tRNA processing enzyme)